MKIQAINSNNQISHKAVNQKFLKRAIENYKRCPRSAQGTLLANITNRAILGLISYQDAIDTLEAIKPYAEGAIDSIEMRIKNLKESM